MDTNFKVLHPFISRAEPKLAFFRFGSLSKTRRDRSLFKTWSEIRDWTKALVATVPDTSKKQKFIFFPYLQKLFSKSSRQMLVEEKAPHNKKKKKKKKKKKNNNNNSKLS